MIAKLVMPAALIALSAACVQYDKYTPIGDRDLRIVFVYASDATPTAGKTTWADHLIDNLNDALINSGTSVLATNAGVFTHDDASASFGSDVYDRRDSMHSNTEFMALRYDNDADIAVLITLDDGGSYAGAARVLSGEDWSEVDLAYANVELGQVQTFVHEIGHLLGADHDRDNTVQPCDEQVDYGCGWGETAVARAHGHGLPGCLRRWPGPRLVSPRAAVLHARRHGQRLPDGRRRRRLERPA